MTIVSKRERRRGHGAATARRGGRRRGAVVERPVNRIEASAPLLDADAETSREERLEEMVLTTWAALTAGHPVECPVCGGPLTLAHGCSACGSRLS